MTRQVVQFMAYIDLAFMAFNKIFQIFLKV